MITADPALFPSRFRSPLGRLPRPAEPRLPLGLPPPRLPDPRPRLHGLGWLRVPRFPRSPHTPRSPPRSPHTPRSAPRAAGTRQNSDRPRPFPSRACARAIFSVGSRGAILAGGGRRGGCACPLRGGDGGVGITGGTGLETSCRVIL